LRDLLAEDPLVEELVSHCNPASPQSHQLAVYTALGAPQVRSADLGGKATSKQLADPGSTQALRAYFFTYVFILYLSSFVSLSQSLAPVTTQAQITAVAAARYREVLVETAQVTYTVLLRSYGFLATAPPCSTPPNMTLLNSV
jgi:hypothetical protein